MLKRYGKWLASGVFTVDLLITIGAFLTAYAAFGHGWLPARFGPLVELQRYAWILLAIVPLWTLFLRTSGVYESHRTEAMKEELTPIIRAVALSGLALFAFLALTKSSYISRPFIALFVAIDGVALVLSRIALRSLLHHARLRGLNSRTVLIVGRGPSAQAQAERIARNAHWGWKLLGFVDEDASTPRPAGGPEVLGSARDIRRLLTEYVVDEVIIAVSPERLADLNRLLLECEEIGVKTRLALDFFPHRIARIELDTLDGSPMLTFTTTPREDWALVLKRTMDIVGASLFLAAFSWLYLLITLLIKATAPGPVFYRQIRVGLNGRRFTFFKFRSMVVDAERKMAELRHLNEMDGPVFKIKNDPRITPLGRFLRKFSLDELPQMWNVLRGEMSLVGPRPPIPSEVERYDAWQRRRLSIRPGLTCLWQVSGRNDINFRQWMELDLKYIDTWSLGLDFKILLQTVPAVLGGRGAS